MPSCFTMIRKLGKWLPFARLLSVAVINMPVPRHGSFMTAGNIGLPLCPPVGDNIERHHPFYDSPIKLSSERHAVIDSCLRSTSRLTGTNGRDSVVWRPAAFGPTSSRFVRIEFWSSGFSDNSASASSFRRALIPRLESERMDECPLSLTQWFQKATIQPVATCLPWKLICCRVCKWWKYRDLLSDLSNNSRVNSTIGSLRS